tara:strand:- start:373 stop:585 length:213 start_codon:yes stop_codon:yes gene_type:complete
MNISIKILRQLIRQELDEIEKVQRLYRRGHPRKKRRLIGLGKNKHTGGGKGHGRPAFKRSLSAPAGGGGS